MIATAPSGLLGRAFELYRRTAASRTAVGLVAANLLPLAGVAFFGWSLWTVLVLYWVENAIVGIWTVPRILLAQGPLVPAEVLRRPRITPLAVASIRALSAPSLGPLPRIAMAVFFLLHYGVFWIGHGIFVFALPRFLGAAAGMGGGLGPLLPGISGPGAVPGSDPTTLVTAPAALVSTPFGEIVWSAVALGGAALFVSHGWSFVANYLGRGEFRTTSPSAAMSAPYGRVVVLHVAIIFGALLIAAFGAPIGALVVLVAGKTLLDLSLHLREHRVRPAA